MSFTISGVFLLAFGFWVFFRKPQDLPFYFVFFAPFSATAILNVTALEYKSGGVGVSVGLLFLVLYIASQILRGNAFRPTRVSAGHLLQIAFMIFFILIMLASQFANAAIRPITSFQLTQTVYVLIGFTATIVLSFEFARDGGVAMVVKAVRASAIFVSIWGLVQFACFVTKVPYPSFLFNNSLSDSADMFDQTMSDTYMRIASVAVEPSVLAASLLHFVPFAATVVVTEPRMRNSYWIWPLALSAAVLVLSTSTTAYFGLAVLAFLLLLARPRVSLIVGVPVCGVLALALALVPRLSTAVLAVTLDKQSTSSYVERTAGAAAAVRLFLEQPLLGWGWGWSSVNWNAITAMLAYTGIIGTVAFLIAAACTLLELRLTRKGQAGGDLWQLAAYASGAQNALIVAFACAISSGIKYVFLDDWYFWAFAIAVTSRLISDRAQQISSNVNLAGLEKAGSDLIAASDRLARGTV